MKKILILLGFLTISGLCYGDVYLTYDIQSEEIVDMSSRNDCVVQEGWEKVILSGDLEDYPIQYHPTYYKYKNAKFVLNMKKISDEEIAKEEAEERRKEMLSINNKAKLKAKKDLEAGGKVFKHIKDEDFPTNVTVGQ